MVFPPTGPGFPSKTDSEGRWLRVCDAADGEMVLKSGQSQGPVALSSRNGASGFVFRVQEGRFKRKG